MEYLESILPPDVRAQLWPLLESAEARPPEAAAAQVEVTAAVSSGSMGAATSSGSMAAASSSGGLPRVLRPTAELLESLKTAYPEVLSKLKLKKSA
jgi:hypothetical protein